MPCFHARFHVFPARESRREVPSAVILMCISAFLRQRADGSVDQAVRQGVVREQRVGAVEEKDVRDSVGTDHSIRIFVVVAGVDHNDFVVIRDQILHKAVRVGVLEKKKVLSQRLIDLIDIRLQKKEQSILFVNKRGFASVVFCNSCDYVATCPHCSTSLTYHKNKDLLCCHLCDYIECFPKKCPKCGGTHITWWTRVIGFLRPIKYFDKERYKEAQTRVYSKKETAC